MVLQAGVGRRVFADNPTYAQRGAVVHRNGRAAPRSTSSTGCSSVLQPDERGTAEPFAPTVADLEDLVERIRSTGRQVDLRADDVDLPASTARAVYRIVQEALTNAVKHTPTGGIRVQVERNESQVSARGRQRVRPPARSGPGPWAGQHAGAGPARGRRARGRAPSTADSGCAPTLPVETAAVTS